MCSITPKVSSLNMATFRILYFIGILQVTVALSQHRSFDRESLLLPYSHTNHRTVPIVFNVYNRRMIDTFYDVTSEAYLELRKEVSQVINHLYSSSYPQSYVGIKDIIFRARSKSCEMTLVFREPINEPEARHVLQNATSGCFLGPLQVVPVCPKVQQALFGPSRKLLYTTDPSVDPCNTCGYVILRIIIWLVFDTLYDVRLDTKFSAYWWEFTYACVRALKLIYGHLNNFAGVEIRNYHRGSVLVDYSVMFNVTREALGNQTEWEASKEYASKTGSATAVSLLSHSNVLTVNGSEYTVTGSYVFNQDPAEEVTGGNFDLKAITFEELCEMPEAYQQICGGEGKCYTGAYQGEDMSRTLHCNCSEGVTSPDCRPPTDPPSTEATQDVPWWIYLLATGLPLGALLFILILVCCIRRRKQGGRDRFFVETTTSGKSRRSDTLSTFTTPTRYHPEYRKNWRMMAPGYLHDLPEHAFDNGAMERDSVETLHRRRYGREWGFTDYHGAEARDADYYDDDSSMDTEDSDYTHGYYMGHNVSYAIPRPFVSTAPIAPFRIPNIRRGTRLRDNGSAVDAMTGTASTSTDRHYH